MRKAVCILVVAMALFAGLFAFSSDIQDMDVFRAISGAFSSFVTVRGTNVVTYGDHFVGGAGTGVVVATSSDAVDLRFLRVDGTWAAPYTNHTQMYKWDDIDVNGAANAPYTLGRRFVKDQDKRVTAFVDVPDYVDTNAPIYLGVAAWPQAALTGSNAVWQLSVWDIEEGEALNGAADYVSVATNVINDVNQYELHKFFFQLPASLVANPDNCWQIEFYHLGTDGGDDIDDTLGLQPTFGIKWTRRNVW